MMWSSGLIRPSAQNRRRAPVEDLRRPAQAEALAAKAAAEEVGLLSLLCPKVWITVGYCRGPDPNRGFDLYTHIYICIYM